MKSKSSKPQRLLTKKLKKISLQDVNIFFIAFQNKDWNTCINFLEPLILHWYELITDFAKRVTVDWFIFHALCKDEFNKSANKICNIFKKYCENPKNLYFELKTILFFALKTISKYKFKPTKFFMRTIQVINIGFIYTLRDTIKKYIRINTPQKFKYKKKIIQPKIKDVLFLSNLNLDPIETYLFLLLSEDLNISEIAKLANIDRERIYFEEKALWLKIKENY